MIRCPYLGGSAAPISCWSKDSFPDVSVVLFPRLFLFDFALAASSVFFHALSLGNVVSTVLQPLQADLHMISMHEGTRWSRDTELATE